jgi:hypothetical protein
MRRKTKKPSKVYPTNKRYDKRVPTTSFRIDPETVKKLFELREASKARTWAKLFRGLVGDYEIKLISIEEARKAGYVLGFRNARLQYAVSFPCADCRQIIFIEGPELISKVRKLIFKAGWGHSECPRPSLPQPPPPKPTPPNVSLPKANPPVVPINKSNGNQDKILRFIQDNPA